jgi:CTP:phosphocholine cytidylyltransferase-like protein
MKRVIIAAGGEAIRWGNYNGTPKHLIEIEGEILLNRTVRQFKKYTDDIIIIARTNDYLINDARLEKPIDGEWYDFGKIYSSHHLWSNDETIIIFGDVYFTDKAVEKIMNFVGEYKFFLRKSGSKLTGKKYAEIFGLYFSNKMKDNIKKSLEYLIDKKQDGVGAWQLYFHMHGINHIRQIGKPVSCGGYIEIDDWTEDFDKPKDFIVWQSMRFKNIKQ